MKRVTMILVLLSVLPVLGYGQEIQVMVVGKVLKSGDTWHTPLGNPANSVALFSEQRDMFQILNKGKSPISLESIELKLADGLAEEEFTLQNTELKPGPLAFAKSTLALQQRYAFHVRFYPVHSGERQATLTIGYNGSKQFTLVLKGKGRTKAQFFSGGKLLFHKLLGGPKTDEMATTMVADSQGNLYFSGHVTQVIDKFAFDIVLGKVNKDGTLGWVKIWNGPYRDFCPDPGQNGESGGSASSLALDEGGNLYLAGAVSNSKSNNLFAILVLKVDSKEGKPIWEKLWRPEWPKQLLAKHNAQGYAVCVSGNTLYVTGTTGAEIIVVSLDAKSGEIKGQKTVDVFKGYTDRGYTVKADDKGNVYVAGSGNNNGILLKFTSDLKLKWVKKVELGLGGNINCLDVDSAGNLYLSCDRRGATTFFSVLKVDAEGKLLWGKTYEGSNNAQNNINLVKVVGEAILVGGRTGLSDYDTQMGDGFVAKLSGQDGALGWASFYFTGKGPNEIAEHRIKGVAFQEGNLLLFGQVYTGNLNGLRYWGYWYDGTGKLIDYRPPISPVYVPEDQVTPVSKGQVKDASTSRTYVDGAPLLLYQDAQAKQDGHGPDGDLMFWSLELKK